MSDKDKIQLADAVMLALKSFESATENIPVACGTLNRRYGLQGFKVLEIGSIVFLFNGRLILYLESLDGKKVVEVPFYYDSLKPCVDFSDAMNLGKTL